MRIFLHLPNSFPSSPSFPFLKSVYYKNREKGTTFSLSGRCTWAFPSPYSQQQQPQRSPVQHHHSPARQPPPPLVIPPPRNTFSPWPHMSSSLLPPFFLLGRTPSLTVTPGHLGAHGRRGKADSILAIQPPYLTPVATPRVSPSSSPSSPPPPDSSRTSATLR